ncbi:MAG TPA: thiamine pyrophosphate-binding protein [Candidatus Binataceae bacterium]|nr:thiamine pyrophosphate-binding protein [Candidatus Binataceae bacterium]
MVTAGPGTTDAMTGVANAFRAESAMLLIGGQGPLAQHRMGSLQDLPHVDMMRPITKFAATVSTTERIADMVSMAFRECYNGAPGPSFLEIPRDVLDARVDLAKARIPAANHYRASTRSAGDPHDVERLADILVKSERPCVLLGTQVWSCRAGAAAIEFCRQLNIPAYMNGAARGTFAPGDPHHFHQTRGYAFEQADTIVIVGTPFDFRMGYGRSLRTDATVVQIDLSYRTVGKNRDISLGIVGDAGAILSATAQAASGRIDNGARRRDGWLSELREQESKRAEALRPRLLSDARPIHPLRLAHEINPFRRRRIRADWMGLRDLRALRAALHRSRRQQLAHEPDSLRADGEIWQGPRRDRKLLGDVHFEQFARMLGGHGEEVREAKDIGPALRRARESGKCALINVWIDPDVYAPGTMNQTMYK